jgi:hypothetical protein
MNTSPCRPNGTELQTPELWVVIAFLVAPWFVNLATIMIGGLEENIASFSIPTSATIFLSAVHAIVFLMFFYASAKLTYKCFIQNRLATSTLVSNNKFAISQRLFLVIISGIMIHILYSALQNGIFQTILEYRFNTRKIGFIGYIVLHFLPILLALRWREKSTKINAILLLLLSALNLITGFRILLAYAFLMIFLLNYKSFAEKKLLLASLGLLIIIGLVLYSMLRGSLESGGDQSEDYRVAQLVLSNLARSLPITYLDLIFSSGYSADISTLFALIFEPVYIILTKLFFVFDVQQPVMWGISEALVRPYLFWRGTPGSEPGGFSIHIFPFAYMFYGYIGLMMFAMFFGFLSGVGIHLIRSDYTVKRAFGGVLLCTTIMSTESFDTMWSLFCNAVMFLTMLTLFSRIFFFLFGNMYRSRKGYIRL